MRFGLVPYSEPSPNALARAGVHGIYRTITIESVLEKMHAGGKKIPRNSEFPTTGTWVDRITQYISRMESALREGVGLFLHGKHNAGKTAIGCLLIREALGRGAMGQMVTGDSLPGIIINDPMYDMEDDVTWREWLIKVDLLLIDEVFSAKDSKIVDYVDRVVRARTNRQRATLLTSNYSPVAMAERGATSLCAAVQRSCAVVEVSGVDWSDEMEARRLSILEGPDE